MEMTKKQTEFWAFIIMLCLAVSIAVLLIDFGIKAAILEESTRLRLIIEENSGRKSEKPASSGTDNDADIDSSMSPDLLVEHTPSVETGNVSNGTAKKASNTSAGGTQPRRPDHPRTIPRGDK